MALKGNLKDFSLPDVFQLVTLSKKTGVLRIQGREADGSVWFREGDVFFATSNWNREPLGERLVQAERITAAALEKALSIQANDPSGRRLGQILIDEGYVTGGVLESFVQEQIQDTIFDIMRWDEGDFHFDPLNLPADEDIGLSVSIENVIMEGSRRLEEWNRIKKKIPSQQMVFKMATAPGEGTFEISLKPLEWNLLLSLDGTITVAELAGITGRNDFEVAKILYGLFSAGLIEVASEEEVARRKAEKAEREESRGAASSGTEAAFGPAAAGAPTADGATAGVQQSAAATPGAAEEPAFLGADEGQPNAADMAAFEKMVGAVLGGESPAEAVPPVPAHQVAPEQPSAPAQPAAPEAQQAAPEAQPAAPAQQAAPEAPPAAPAQQAAPEAPPVQPAAVQSQQPAAQPPQAPSSAGPMAASQPQSPAEQPASQAQTQAPSEPAEPAEPAEPEEPAQPGVAEPMSAQQPGSAEAPQVLSTDAFTADLELDISGVGLTSEITALTGAERQGRPTANVNRLPSNDGEQTLHIDSSVDRDLVMKIIDGIKNL